MPRGGAGGYCSVPGLYLAVADWSTPAPPFKRHRRGVIVLVAASQFLAPAINLLIDVNVGGTVDDVRNNSFGRTQ